LVIINRAFPIPDSLPTVGAAPLLCAGLTSWSPFIHNKVKAGDRVGIIGVGGLGHLAIQFGVKMGCEVYGISTSANKAEEIKKYGARGIIVSTNATEMVAAANSFDFILSTIEHDNINWDSYLNLLRPGISIYNMHYML
jgi:D-arabinose 1-dehydrogenase-like Zn-dependent alcohol dehydrogenase